MEYYYTDGINNFGPFTLDQLREKNITATTKVWYSGMANWTPASEVPELAGILQAAEPSPVSPPPVENTYRTEPSSMQTIPPKTYFMEAVLVTLFCCQPFGVVAIVYSALVESAIASGNYTEAHRVSKLAAKWLKIAFFSGLAFILIFGILYASIILTAIKNVPSFQGY